MFIDVTCLSFVDIFDGLDPELPLRKKKFRENSCFFVRKTKVLTNCFFPNSHSATRIVRSAPQYLSVDACVTKKKKFRSENISLEELIKPLLNFPEHNEIYLNDLQEIPN